MIRHPITWPNGARCACAITFDMDADSLIHVAGSCEPRKDGVQGLFHLEEHLGLGMARNLG